MFTCTCLGMGKSREKMNARHAYSYCHLDHDLPIKVSMIVAAVLVARNEVKLPNVHTRLKRM
jgi:hypothetical protein